MCPCAKNKMAGAKGLAVQFSSHVVTLMMPKVQSRHCTKGNSFMYMTYDIADGPS